MKRVAVESLLAEAKKLEIEAGKLEGKDRIAKLEAAKKQYDQAAKVTVSSMALIPIEGSIARIVEEVNYHKGSFKSQSNPAATAVNQNPRQHEVSDEKIRATIYNRRGWNDREKGNYLDAAENFAKAAQYGDNKKLKGMSCFNAAFCYEKAGEGQNAAQFYEKYADHLEDKDDYKPQKYRKAAEYHNELGDHEQAARCYQKSAYYEKTKLFKYIKYSQAAKHYEAIEDYQSSAICFEKAACYTASESKKEKFDKSVLYSQAARDYQEVGNYTKSEECFNHALNFATESKRSTRLLFALSRLSHSLGDVRKSCRYIEQSLDTVS